MKLGFLLFDYFPYGGLQRDCLKIAAVCAARGHDVIIFTRTWQGTQPANIKVTLFGRSGWSNVSRNRHWLKQLAATLPGQNLDGMVGFNKVPGIDLYFGSDPCYVAKVERLKPAWYRYLPRYRHFKKLEEAVFRRGEKSRILLLTDHEIPLYQRHYGTERERFHVLPPGIERQEVSGTQKEQARERCRSELGCDSQEKLLLFIGSGFRVKGLDRAIIAFSTFPPALRQQTRLVVIGQNRPGKFAWLARKSGVIDRVHFLGGRPDARAWMMGSDLLVHPAYSESAGMVLLEAMTAGLPILTTATCGYAFHVSRAKAGSVLPSPFSQIECNRLLTEMLVSDERADWKSNGLNYAATEDLYSCHSRAADIIEATITTKGA